MTQPAEADGPTGTPDSHHGSTDPAATSPAGAETAPGLPPGTPPDDLPEWEPLTPELVEDEAIRGDFVMRWAVVGLAVLLGCSQIADTKTLVHIRSGEYLASHGMLPPAHDYLAYTRSDQSWVNLSWLFDLIAAGVHRVGGGIGLSLFQALLAAGAFTLLAHAVRPGIRTWWGSICGALALLACFRQFTLQPELITLLGVAGVMFWLTQTQEGPLASRAWWIIPFIWLWCQLDPRAYLGWGGVLIYGLGEGIGLLAGRPGFASAQRRQQFWMFAGACFLIAAVNPFLWAAWTSPVTIYGAEYPAWRATYAVPSRNELGVFPLLDVRFWALLNHEGVAGMYLAVAALGTMLLNWPRLRGGHAALWLGINALPFLASRELAAASLVNCVLATVNAQEWYLARYGQTYSIQTGFLLFSRGGRAVTVVGLFAIAYLIISGRIDGPNGKRTGLGFEDQLQMLMTGYDQAFHDRDGKSISYDDRPFPFVVRQGDLLIWAGQKSFIDSRLELFHPGGADSLQSLHNKTRVALRGSQSGLPGSGDQRQWKKVFDQYEITHVASRMSGLTLAPNYSTFDDLVRSPSWKMTRLNGAVAIFYRTDKRADRELKSYLETQQLDLGQVAFRAETQPVTEPQVWPAPTTPYQQMLSLPKEQVPGPVAEASHYVHYAMQNRLTLPQRLGALQLAIRAARAGLRENPNSASAYRVLGAAYSLLDNLESGDLRRYGINAPHLLRYYQIASAYQQALLLEPNDSYLHQETANFYLRIERSDLALRHLKEVLRLRAVNAADASDEALEQLQQMENLAGQLESHVARLQGEIDKQLANGSPRLNAALWAFQNGAVLAAVDVLEGDRVALVQSPPAQVMLAGWLIETGRVEEADQTLRSLERQGPMVDMLQGWRDSAAYSAWAQGDYVRVAKLYEDVIDHNERRRVTALLGTGPMSAAASPLLPEHRFPWLHTAAAEETVGLRPTELGSQLLHLALCRLEQGDLAATKAAFEKMISNAPTSYYRPLLISYWYCLTGEQLEIEPPEDWIPVTSDLFAEEAG